MNYDETKILRLTLNSAIPLKKRRSIEKLMFRAATDANVDIIIDAMPLQNDTSHILRYSFGVKPTEVMRRFKDGIARCIPHSLLKMKEEV